MPEWAEGWPDKCGALKWDSSQFVAYIGVNRVLTLGVVNTGSCTTLLDTKMAA